LPKQYSRNKLNLNTIDHLSRRLGFPSKEIEIVASKANTLYRFDKQPKKSGGYRIISKPRPRLKRIQSAIHKLLQEIKVSDAAHGSIKNRSHHSNASVHCNSMHVVNFDITNFYPSIMHTRVYAMFHKGMGCAPTVASVLTKLTTVNGQVPQGSPTSSDIANLILLSADCRLGGLAKKYGLKYTRYIDDMTFSGDKVPDQLSFWVNEILTQTGFELNKDKEKMMGRNEAQQVTGLNVNRKHPTVPRSIQREVRQQAHIFTKYESEQLREPERYARKQKIQGKIGYIDYIKRKHQESP
jgi:RNA-directed DNA polymerase